MNCTQAEEIIFAAEELSEESLSPDLATHLRSCASCRALLVKLQNLENAARALPMPGNIAAARNAFLARLSPTPFQSASRRMWYSRLTQTPSRWTVAVAASILILVSAGAWLLIAILHGNAPPLATAPLTKPQVETASVVDQLVDFNVELADANTPAERDQIFATQASALKQTFEKSSLPDEERELGAKLMENGVWLSMNNDPLAGAEKFGDLADILLKRIKIASAAGNKPAVSRLTRLYGLVVAAGVDPQLKRSQGGEIKNPDIAKRQEKMLRRNADLEQQFQDLIAHSPEMSRQQIRQELKQIRQTWLERRRARLRQTGQ